jgi:SAM-dependent methyltransferase
MTEAAPWYASWFESPWYVHLYGHRTLEEARKAVTLVQDVARVPVGARVLDVCCGYGRHALALAQAGYRATGLDGSAFLIDRARREFSHPLVDYIVGDMRGPYPGAPYQAIVNFFTSYGYFDTDEENAAVARHMAVCVEPAGIVIIDVFNAPALQKVLVPETVSMVQGATVVQERWIEGPFVRKKITITNPCSHDLEFEERVWLTTLADLERHTASANLRIERVVGDYDGSPFNEATSPRCIVIARRPA